jgi:hypothetical protein
LPGQHDALAEGLPLAGVPRLPWDGEQHPDEASTEGAAPVLQAIGVFLLGVLLTASGILVATMYDIGIVVMFIGAIGILIRFIDWLRFIRT